MYALPGQSLVQAMHDVQTALTFSPRRLSCYHLTLEPNTLFYRNPPPLPDDDASSDMQQSIELLLTENGFPAFRIFGICGNSGRRSGTISITGRSGTIWG